MTIRRWNDEVGSKKIPKVYERSIVEGIFQLIIDGHLEADSEAVLDAVRDSTSLSSQAAIQGLGFVNALTAANSSHEDKMAVALFQIGSSEKRKKKVLNSKSELTTFKKLGKEWNRYISTLMEIVHSSKFTVMDKLVAFGALFYLICPFDLIPDYVPVVGLVDDFGILSFAMIYYLNKFPKLISEIQDANPSVQKV